MPYPLISEYIEAIRNAEDNFDKLAHLRPIYDNLGNPVMSCGNFAVVFKMSDSSNGKLYAVKCFTREQPGREQCYSLISETLSNLSSQYMLHAEYYENELFVDSNNTTHEEFPVLLMDWVEGQTLDAFISNNLHNDYNLSLLAYNFCQAGAWLMLQPFSHGDLKPDNILIREDMSLVFVDYDGMFVSEMKGQPAREIGSPNYRHPLRIQETFNEHIDDFAILSIALSLKSISIKPDLYTKFHSQDILLLGQDDFRNIGNSPAIHEIVKLCNDTEVSKLFGSFMIAFANEGYQWVNPCNIVIKQPKKTTFNYGDMLMMCKKAIKEKKTEQFIQLCYLNISRKEHIGESYVGLALSVDYNKDITMGSLETTMVVYLEKALEYRSGEAASLLGNSYLYGSLGLDKNAKKAFEHIKKGHEWGNINATQGLAHCYYNGVGVKQDLDLTYEFVKQAAHGGQPYAQYMYGYWYYIGSFDENGAVYLKGSRDLQKAIYWLRKAGIGEIDRACHCLSGIYKSYSKDKNFLLAKYWGDKAHLYSHGSRGSLIYDEFDEEEKVFVSHRLLNEEETACISSLEYIEREGFGALSFTFNEEPGVLILNLSQKQNHSLKSLSSIDPSRVGINMYRDSRFDFCSYYKMTID